MENPSLVFLRWVLCPLDLAEGGKLLSALLHVRMNFQQSQQVILVSIMTFTTTGVPNSPNNKYLSQPSLRDLNIDPLISVAPLAKMLSFLSVGFFGIRSSTALHWEINPCTFVKRDVIYNLLSSSCLTKPCADRGHAHSG